MSSQGSSCPGCAQELLRSVGGQGLPPTEAHHAHHPEKAGPVFRDVQLWVHGLQEPLEVLTLELGPELPPLRHVPKGFLGKQHHSESLQAQHFLRKPRLPGAHSLRSQSTETKQPQGRVTAYLGTKCIVNTVHSFFVMCLFHKLSEDPLPGYSPPNTGT